MSEQATEVITKNLEIRLLTKDLLYALSFAKSVVEKRNVLQELSNIKISAYNSEIEIGATDIDLYLNQKVGAKIVSEGETTVSIQTLFDIVRKVSDEEITIRQSDKDDKLEIIGKNYRFELLTLPTAHFPEMHDVNSESRISIACQDMAKIIEYTQFSMSKDETRYNLNGVYMHVEGDNFCGVATDGHRLSIASVPLDSSYSDFGIIVPRKTIAELLKILKDSRNIQSELEIFLSSNKVKFKCKDIILISKVIDGVFPTYTNFIPSESKNILTINRKALYDAIDRVSTVTVDKFRAVKLVIDNTGLVSIIASGEEKGAANENIPISSDKKTFCEFKGGDISIGFNPSYIIDVLGALKGDNISIYITDQTSPILIKVNEENSMDKFVVMPVKV